MDDGIEKSANKGLTRRSLVMGAGALAVSLPLAACGPNEQKPPEKKPEAVPAQQIIKEKLSDRQEGDVQKIVDAAIGKWDTVGKVLFEVQNGALPKNYRQFVIRNTYGPRYTEKGMDFDETIIAKRDELLKSDSFKRDFFRALQARGYFKPLTKQQEDNLYKRDESYSNFRYSMWMTLPGAEPGYKPGDVKPEQLGAAEFESYASHLELSARYFDSSKNGVSFTWSYGWKR